MMKVSCESIVFCTILLAAIAFDHADAADSSTLRNGRVQRKRKLIKVSDEVEEPQASEISSEVSFLDIEDADLARTLMEMSLSMSMDMSMPSGIISGDDDDDDDDDSEGDDDDDDEEEDDGEEDDEEEDDEEEEEETEVVERDEVEGDINGEPEPKEDETDEEEDESSASLRRLTFVTATIALAVPLLL